jgi:hypothetical protein
MKKTEYHYAVMTQKDLLQNEVLEEVLRERVTFYSIRKRLPDYWILVSPEFIYQNGILEKIHKTNFFKNKKALIYSPLLPKDNPSEFYAAIVSTDPEFMVWLKLRLGYFENIDENKDKLSENSTSNGICGSFKVAEVKSPLKSYSSFLWPEIALKKNIKFLNLYYKAFTKLIKRSIPSA